MKYEFELTDEIDEQTPPGDRWFDFQQDVERVTKKLKISKAEIARRLGISPSQLNKLITGKDGAKKKIRDVQNYYFLALKAIEYEQAIRQARILEET